MAKLAVGVLGATGAVGQRFVQLLADHPWFEVEGAGGVGSLGGQARTGRRARGGWARRCRSRWPTAWSRPATSRSSPRSCSPASTPRSRARSRRPSSERGHAVVSNSRNHRMDPDVPLLIPEVNPDHLDALAVQRKRTGGGYIVTNPNCSVVGLAMALAPLQRAFGLDVGGGGHPAGALRRRLSGRGLARHRRQRRSRTSAAARRRRSRPSRCRILGTFADGAFEHAPFRVSASVHRVAVTDGHTMAVFVQPGKKAHGRARRREPSPPSAASPRSGSCPPPRGAHPRPAAGATGPQPRLDRDREGGMAVSVGRVRDGHACST